MSPPENTRNEDSAPRKSDKGEGSSSRGSPDRYRHRDPDTFPRRYQSHSERPHYTNRAWRRDSSYSRHSSHNYRYDRKRYDSDEPPRHDDDRSKTGRSDRESNSYRRPWRGPRSPGRPRPNRSRWDEAPRSDSSKHSSYESGKFTEHFRSIFMNHINDVYTTATHTQPERPMSFIDKLIADEAMRMLSQAASLQEMTYLNAPCESMAVDGQSSVRPEDGSEATESAKPDSEKLTTGEQQTPAARDAAVVNAADSALLQKSAEQVTKKLINQLTTMSKYDLKQIIDNPGGKYETALNRHAQNKLRAEVRKQLKSIGINELGSACVGVEPDEAIDANQIPPALLAQIGEALDLDLEDLTQTDTESIEHVANSIELQSGEGGDEAMGLRTASTAAQDALMQDTASTAVQDATTTEIANKTLPKVRIAHKPAPSTPGRKKKINTQNANSPSSGNGTGSPKNQPKSKTPNRKKSPKGKGVNGEGGKNASPKAAKTPQKGNANAPAKHKPSPGKKGISSTLKIAKVYSTQATFFNNLTKNFVTESYPPPVELSDVPKMVPCLRISTVEELNRRLDDHEEAEKEQNAPELSATEEFVIEDGVQAHDNLIGSSQSTTSNDSPTSGTTNRESYDSIQNRINNDQQSEAPVSSTSVQEPEQQDDIPIFQRLIERRKKHDKSVIAKHLEGILSKKNELRLTGYGEMIASRLNRKPGLNGKDYLEMVLPSGRKASPLGKAKWVPQRDVSRKRKNSSETVSNGVISTEQEKATIETGDATGIEQIRSKLPIVPDTHLGRQSKKRLRWCGQHPGDTSAAAIFNRKPKEKESERVPSPLAPSGEDELLKEANDQYKAQDDADRTQDGRSSVASGTAQDTSDLPGQVNLPSIRVRSYLFSPNAQELSSSDTPLVESTLSEGAQELSLTEKTTNSSVLAASEQHVATSGSVYGEGALPEENLPITEPVVDSKEGIERIPSPEPDLDSSAPTDEYILGGESEQKCEPVHPGTAINETQEEEPQQQVQEQPSPTYPSETPQPSAYVVRLQSLHAVAKQLQSIDAQTMDLYNRKTQIDAIIMQLNAERMDINQQLVKLHQARGEQMNCMGITLLELGMSDGSDGPSAFASPPTAMSFSTGSQLNADPMNQTVHSTAATGPLPTSATAAVPQERTIRRITPIGNNVLMKIFQRRRAPSERSTEENLAPPDVAH